MPARPFPCWACHLCLHTCIEANPVPAVGCAKADSSIFSLLDVISVNSTCFSFPSRCCRLDWTSASHRLKMPTGVCLCGEIKISYSGQPAVTVSRSSDQPHIRCTDEKCLSKAICHCDDDRRMSNYQTFQVPKQNFTLEQGEPKVYTKLSDFGRVSLCLFVRNLV